MPNGTSRITVPIPLFSTDYAQVNREISEWNRRARPSFASIEIQLNLLQEQLNDLTFPTSGIATSNTFGTVKVNNTVSNPVVYLKSAVDALIANLQSQINTINTLINNNSIPTLVYTNQGESPIFPAVVGVSGIFGNQRATNTFDGSWWTWNGSGWSVG